MTSTGWPAHSDFLHSRPGNGIEIRCPKLPEEMFLASNELCVGNDVGNWMHLANAAIQAAIRLANRLVAVHTSIHSNPVANSARRTFTAEFRLLNASSIRMACARAGDRVQAAGCLHTLEPIASEIWNGKKTEATGMDVPSIILYPYRMDSCCICSPRAC